MKVLVCGGRDFSDRGKLDAGLRIIDRNYGPITEIIHGAATGADTLAAEWAKSVGLPSQAFPAEWGKYGKRAGPIRNQRMLSEAKPDLVIAFPGGIGTKDMLDRAQRANVRCFRFGWPRAEKRQPPPEAGLPRR